MPMEMLVFTEYQISLSFFCDTVTIETMFILLNSFLMEIY